MPRTKRINLRTDTPCPCGSGKAIADCHLDIDGNLRKPRPNLCPPAPKTGFSHTGCYLRDTADCSEKISREHYISQSVLDQLGSLLRVSGAPWLKSEETFDTTAVNLTAKILCQRHNSALAPLDTEAGHFFSVLTDALLDLDRKTLSRRPVFHLVNGEALELWMLKVACGLYFAVGAKDGARVTEKYTIDLARVQRALFDSRWDSRAGLYFRGMTGSVIRVAHQIGFAPLLMDSSLRFSGASVSMNGFMLELIFDQRDTHIGAWAGLTRRPSELVLKKKLREHHIILTWPMGTPQASVTMTELGNRRPKISSSDSL